MAQNGYWSMQWTEYREPYESEAGKAARLKREDDAQKRARRARDTSSRKDEFTHIRKAMERQIDDLGGRAYLAKWLLIQDIEDMIDAKVAAAIEPPVHNASETS